MALARAKSQGQSRSVDSAASPALILYTPLPVLLCAVDYVCRPVVDRRPLAAPPPPANTAPCAPAGLIVPPLPVWCRLVLLLLAQSGRIQGREHLAGVGRHGAAKLTYAAGELQPLGTANLEVRLGQIGVHAFGHFPGVDLGVFDGHAGDLPQGVAAENAVRIGRQECLVGRDRRGKLVAEFGRRRLVGLAIGHRLGQGLGGPAVERRRGHGAGRLGRARAAGRPTGPRASRRRRTWRNRRTRPPPPRTPRTARTGGRCPARARRPAAPAGWPEWSPIHLVQAASTSLSSGVRLIFSVAFILLQCGA